MLRRTVVSGMSRWERGGGWGQGWRKSGSTEGERCNHGIMTADGQGALCLCESTTRKICPATTPPSLTSCQLARMLLEPFLEPLKQRERVSRGTREPCQHTILQAADLASGEKGRASSGRAVWERTRSGSRSTSWTAARRESRRRRRGRGATRHTHTFLAFGFTTIEPWLTCPSPISTVLPSCSNAKA